MMETQQVVTGDAPSPRRHAIAAVGMLLYCLGLLMPAMHVAAHIGLPLRLAGLVLLAWSAWRRRSLMAWIFWAMIAGGELGADAPAHAVTLRVFSDIFLRLIKAIVAPLILGTLITGLAGHGEMRSVGRLGLKSLIYFEVLTTIALVIGLVAINVSKAGSGLGAVSQPVTAHS